MNKNLSNLHHPRDSILYEAVNFIALHTVYHSADDGLVNILALRNGANPVNFTMGRANH